MKVLKLGVYLNVQTNFPAEEKVFNAVFIDRGGGEGVILLTEGIANNPQDQSLMKMFPISERLLSNNQLPIQVKLLALTPTNLEELCAPIFMNLTSNEAAETLVFPVLSNTGDMIGQLYVSYHLNVGEYSGHGGSGPAYQPLTQAHLNYQQPPARTSTQHLPMGHHHGSLTNFVQQPLESVSQPLINVQGYPVQGYRPGSIPADYVGPPQPPVCPPLQQQPSKMKKFLAAVGSFAKRIGVLVCVNVIAEAAGAAVASDDEGGLIE